MAEKLNWWDSLFHAYDEGKLNAKGWLSENQVKQRIKDRYPQFDEKKINRIYDMYRDAYDDAHSNWFDFTEDTLNEYLNQYDKTSLGGTQNVNLDPYGKTTDDKTWKSDEGKTVTVGQGKEDENALKTLTAKGQEISDRENALNQADLAAQNAAEQEAQQLASTSAIQGVNAGINRERAGMNSVDNTATRSNANSQLAGNAASTQADYLAKLGAAQNAQQTANNMALGQSLSAINAALQGASAGAKMGGSFGTSDEREKEPIKDISDEDIIREVAKLFDLKRQLDEIKEKK